MSLFDKRYPTDKFGGYFSSNSEAKAGQSQSQGYHQGGGGGYRREGYQGGGGGGA